jgi:non-heme chloroperoxidase
MSTTRSSIDSITVPDGTRIHFTDCGHGTPVVFSHGWPLSGAAWEDQMLFLAEHGYRVIATTAAAMAAPPSRGTATT